MHRIIAMLRGIHLGNSQTRASYNWWFNVRISQSIKITALGLSYFIFDGDAIGFAVGDNPVGLVVVVVGVDGSGGFKNGLNLTKTVIVFASLIILNKYKKEEKKRVNCMRN